MPKPDNPSDMKIYTFIFCPIPSPLLLHLFEMEDISSVSSCSGHGPALYAACGSGGPRRAQAWKADKDSRRSTSSPNSLFTGCQSTAGQREGLCSCQCWLTLAWPLQRLKSKTGATGKVVDWEERSTNWSMYWFSGRMNTVFADQTWLRNAVTCAKSAK